jgi:hypothetical protein
VIYIMGKHTGATHVHCVPYILHFVCLLLHAFCYLSLLKSHSGIVYQYELALISVEHSGYRSAITCLLYYAVLHK